MDLRKLKTLIDLVSDSNVTELEITEAEGKVRIVKGPTPSGAPVLSHQVMAPAAPALPSAPLAPPTAAEIADAAAVTAAAVAADEAHAFARLQAKTHLVEQQVVAVSGGNVVET